MKEKIKVTIMGDIHESTWNVNFDIYPYRMHSEYIDISKKCYKSCCYHIQTTLSHKNSNLLHITLSYSYKDLHSWIICFLGGNLTISK